MGEWLNPTAFEAVLYRFDSCRGNLFCNGEKMNINTMSPQELRALADKKEQESKVQKIGYLKHDLYSLDMDYDLSRSLKEGLFCIEKSEKEKIEKKIKSLFKVIAKKNTKFVCFIIDDEECWFDDENIGIENMSQEWAEKI